MKIDKLLHLAVEIVYIICVTLAAMHFNNAGLLWWFALVLFFRAWK